MVTLCTVVLQDMEPYTDILFDSVKKTKFIKEVLVAQADADSSLNKEWEQHGRLFRQFGLGIDKRLMCVGHSLGLHECINRSTQPYVMFTDPDTFFCGPTDEIYLNLMNDHNLNIIGVSHHAAVNQCYGFFPCVMNMLVKKTDLPGEDFLKGKLKLTCSVRDVDPDGEPADGKYLVNGKIEEYAAQFPNKSGPSVLYDIGCNLYLWSQQQDWSWFSFQTTDCHLYTTRYYKSNKARPKLKVEKLLYHATASSLGQHTDTFRQEYESYK